jgi:DNA-binding phage protein
MKAFRDYVKEKMKDPEEAVIYLNTALEEFEKDQDSDAILLALQTVADAKRGLKEAVDDVKNDRVSSIETLWDSIDD